MDVVQKSLKTTLFIAGKTLKHPVVSTVLAMMVALYGGVIAPKLPMWLIKMLDTPLMRIFVIALIAMMANINIQLALVISVAFIITMQLFSKRQNEEGFIADIEGFYGGQWQQPEQMVELP